MDPLPAHLAATAHQFSLLNVRIILQFTALDVALVEVTSVIELLTAHRCHSFWVTLSLFFL